MRKAICAMCGTQRQDEYGSDIYFNWCYGSGRDSENCHWDICESCAEKIKQFIENNSKDVK